ncbi:MAG: type II CAAX endopeptidase family protein [Mobilicoccus sp.]|nr:type II CAAX endopeptidase family protein [Mobilicoccus sp.]
MRGTVMQNLLATHLTTWKWWYAIPTSFVLVLASVVTMVSMLFTELEPQTQALLTALLVPLQFILYGVLSLGIIALLSRRWPTRGDLGLKAGLTRRDLVIVGIVFVVTHAIFFIIGRLNPQPGQAEAYFQESNLGGPVLMSFITLFTMVILAPTCEELLYRGAILRPIHDALARRGMATLGAVVGILVSSVAFALPHLGGDLTGWQALAYMVTGVGFGLVYVLTGSMTAAMVAHSLQSCLVMFQILAFGSGDHQVHPILWVLVVGTPIWVFLIARALASTGSSCRATDLLLRRTLPLTAGGGAPIGGGARMPHDTSARHPATEGTQMTTRRTPERLRAHGERGVR